MSASRRLGEDRGRSRLAVRARLVQRGTIGRPGLGERQNRVTVHTEVLQPWGQPVAVDYRVVLSDRRWLNGLIAELQGCHATAPEG